MAFKKCELVLAGCKGICTRGCLIQLVLFCTVSDDLTYSRATPTFHHWQTGSCSYGLTFQSPSEANTFAKTVKRSVGALRHECRPEGTCSAFL